MGQITQLLIEWKTTTTEPPLNNQKLFNYSNELAHQDLYFIYPILAPIGRGLSGKKSEN